MSIYDSLQGFTECQDIHLTDHWAVHELITAVAVQILFGFRASGVEHEPQLDF